MAVIKIVPMPGAVGDKGDEGAPGPRGPQGERGLQGVPGADALWSYNGEYNPGAGYAVGDVVTYEGQLWYRKHANGGNVGDTPSQGFIWDLLAAKGADSTPLNFWNFTGDRGVPTEDGLLVVDGISGRSATGQGNVSIFAGPSASVVLAGNSGEFLKDTNIPANQIATIGDITTPTSGTWDAEIAERSGIIGGVYASEDVKLGRYYTIGDLVFIEVNFAVAQPTSWGSELQSFSGKLPFKMAESWQDGVSSLSIRHRLKGQMTLRGDSEPFETPYEDNEQNFISVDAVLIKNPTDSPDSFLIAAEGEEISPNTNVNSTYIVSKSWPVNLNVPNSGNINAPSPYMSLRFSGVYRKA